jgi:hypothetical protein
MSGRRYSPTYQCPEDWSDDSAMVACDDGLYVLATDYDALQAEVERLKEVVTALAKFDGRNNITALREMAREALAATSQASTTNGCRAGGAT